VARGNAGTGAVRPGRDLHWMLAPVASPLSFRFDKPDDFSRKPPRLSAEISSGLPGSSGFIVRGVNGNLASVPRL